MRPPHRALLPRPAPAALCRRAQIESSLPVHRIHPRRTSGMTPEAHVRLAREILEAEGLAAEDPSSVLQACARVLDRLHDQLRPLVGTGGFETLLGRAVVVGARHHPGLIGLSVPRTGSPVAEDLLQSLGDEAGVVSRDMTERLVAELLGFLARLVGWGLTLVLLHDPWPEVADRYDATAFHNSSSSRPTPDEG